LQVYLAAWTMTQANDDRRSDGGSMPDRIPDMLPQVGGFRITFGSFRHYARPLAHELHELDARRCSRGNLLKLNRRDRPLVHDANDVRWCATTAVKRRDDVSACGASQGRYRQTSSCGSRRNLISRLSRAALLQPRRDVRSASYTPARPYSAGGVANVRKEANVGS
jgi:hypothetical protein